MTALLTDPHAWLAFLTLALLEIVLGIDNLVFISILVARVPAELQDRARISGLTLAMVTRIALLFSLVWLTHLTAPLFTVADQAVSARDLVMLGGGLFLLVKSVLEIHGTLEGAADDTHSAPRGGFLAVIIQIGLIDIVFSLDSVFTAVGLANDILIMAAAIVVAIVVMMVVSRSVGAFIARHPTIKMLALAFLILIGFALVAEGLHFDIPKGYLYFAMAFSIGVELINVQLRKRLERRRGQSPPG
ncbi:MAG TPA: TerC family protein [Steroidobacteraceae bacterium]|jgi:predicted tellurium resistance membrane protein TerC